MALAILKFLAYDIVLDALYAPIWWYSAGLVRTLRSLWRAFREGAGIIGIGIWARSVFKPMYGEYSWQGRIISFFMRLVILIFMVVQMGIWIGILCVLLAVWLALPLALAWQLIRVVTLS